VPTLAAFSTGTLLIPPSALGPVHRL